MASCPSDSFPCLHQFVDQQTLGDSFRITSKAARFLLCFIKYRPDHRSSAHKTSTRLNLCYYSGYSSTYASQSNTEVKMFLVLCGTRLALSLMVTSSARICPVKLNVRRILFQKDTTETKPVSAVSHLQQTALTDRSVRR